MRRDLPDRLRHLRGLLDQLLAGDDESALPGAALARRAADRLDRDLLPRTASGHAHLVVGIVGPNNAGKSSLFNGMVGRRMSPSTPTGGATCHLLAAAHPQLRARLLEEPTLAQFPLRTVKADPEGVAQAVEPGGDPGELLLVEIAELPPNILLIDTPDFDSILTDNRRASESLLKVADLAIVVVTRHTYQNREVVSFLEGWLAHGRPWMLVYNESISPQITADHAAKLAADLHSPPLAVFHAPFDLKVQQEEHLLAPVSLAPPETTLSTWLFELRQSEDIKVKALTASLAQLRDEVSALHAAVTEEAAYAQAVLDLAARHTGQLGRDVAGQAMPMKPFLEAFRAVLDRRPNLLQRGVRGALRNTRLLFERAFGRLPHRRRSVAAKDARLVDVERAALERRWAPFFETLVEDLRSLGSISHWEQELGPVLAARLSEDVRSEALPRARERAAANLAEDPDVMRTFQQACEELIEAELEARGSEWFLQIAVDAVHLLPSVLAGIVIFKTGGLGWDVAVGGAGTFSSLLMERLSKLLGTRVARRARERWMRLRGARLSEVVLGAVLGESGPLLHRRVRERRQAAIELNQQLEELPWHEMTPASTPDRS
jgi:hypothetical protein